ncbi:MAG: hypothetical protein DRI44_01355 [Chlamydiae bacterium]|nr:MAG: hypothetical protein DRI44_01355 [Chlamydiota bacterium]
MIENKENLNNFIEVAETEHTAYIKIHGKGTFKLAPDFKDFVEQEMRKKIRGVLIDLYYCETLDSTFIGTITSLTLKYKKNGRSQVRLFNVNKHIRAILKNLGLINIIDIFDEVKNDSAEFTNIKATDRSKIEIADLMLDAHETLASLNDKNAAEFKNVVDMLSKKVK